MFRFHLLGICRAKQTLSESQVSLNAHGGIFLNTLADFSQRSQLLERTRTLNASAVRAAFREPSHAPESSRKGMHATIGRAEVLKQTKSEAHSDRVISLNKVSCALQLSCRAVRLSRDQDLAWQTMFSLLEIYGINVGFEHNLSLDPNFTNPTVSLRDNDVEAKLAMKAAQDQRHAMVLSTLLPCALCSHLTALCSVCMSET